MAIRRLNSTQDTMFDPYGAQIVDPEPSPGTYNPNPVEANPNTESGNGATPNPQTGGVTGTTNPQAPQRTAYDPMLGWDVTKLNGDAGSGKYQFGRWLQGSSYYNGGSGASSRGNMQSLVDAYNQATGSHARATGEDAVDFGDGNGAIDIINGENNRWQWLVPGGASSTQPTGQANGAAGQLGSLFSMLGNVTSGLQQTGGAEPMSSGTSTQPQGIQRASNLATSLEAARMPYEIARRTQMNNAKATLADRGMLSEPGHQQGGDVTALQNIETGLAPAYTGAINDRLQQLDALGLGELEQNRLWQQFLSDYGLNRDKVMYDMQHGNMDQYLQALQLWLQAAQTSANGYI